MILWSTPFVFHYNNGNLKILKNEMYLSMKMSHDVIILFKDYFIN